MRTRHAAGFTLIELMTALALMMIVISGALLIVVASARSSRQAMERTDAQRGARSALNVLSTEIELAGLGLPARLAFGRFDADATDGVDDADSEPNACALSPELQVASLDYLREWTVVPGNNTGDDTSGVLTVSDPNPEPLNKVQDIALPEREWVFFYQSPRVDTSGTDHGHGLVRLAAPRAQSALSFTTGSTVFGAQSGFNVGQTFSGRDAKVLRARVSKFGLMCPTGQPYPRYLYWSVGGRSQVPVARNVKSLAFRFHFDSDHDGLPDDKDSDGQMTAADLDSVATMAQLATVKAVEVVVQICVEEPKNNDCRARPFSQIIPTRNMNTRWPSSSEPPTYVFIDNTGLRAP